jgi:hypothetical protein
MQTVVLPAVLYGYKIWPLSLREEYRLTLFDNTTQRRLFGPEKNETI